ncbi:uncharacterized protein I303_103274 [Kwoniella dejecticola CBS 10117]|uniref:Short-chain dehydrogenase n=1 Tax=Kwoniella dejecticola CBS 10117 TaxID=1296121 RepID=A0A1A6A6A1_9TREE|nr:uncharacterized protein I303_03297 [Kwoniella dejecticola CBS 10117]OBR85586.1 hypothetical protein I303_03297 [Kwoniella dejecticola CBS 10117]
MSKIALILGSGARIGQAVANKFSSAGYRVATVSRTPRTYDKDTLVHLTADFNDPASIEPIFDQVEELWGKSPDVVVYNAYSFAFTPSGPLSAEIGELAKSLNGNTVSPYSAAQIAHARNGGVTFIYTGNALNTLVDPNLTTLGVGKSASAHWIQAAAKAEQLRPAKFYYCDQRTPEGKPCYTGLKGEAHADLYLRLAQEEEQGDPIVIFRA